MATRKTKMILGAAAAVAAGTGYFIYSVFAVQGQGALAQAPLNVTTSVQPALIMAVDDSGSMDFETVLPTNDGSAWFDAQRDTFYGLDLNNNAVPGLLNFNGVGGATDNQWKKYAYLFPFGGGADGKNSADDVNDHFAIPPTPQFGWARAPSVNRAYFDPETTYDPWIESNGSFLQGVAGINATTGQVSSSSAPADPKRGNARLNLTADLAYTGGNAVFMMHSGMTLPAGTRYLQNVCSNGGQLGTPLQVAADALFGAPGFRLAQGDRLVTGGDGRARCGVAISYFPATFYIPAGDAASVAAAINYLGTAIVDDGAKAPDGTALRRFEIRTANFSGSGYNTAMNNFANWFSYYRKRHQATRAGITQAFGNSKDSLRAGYFTINARNTVAMRDMSLATERTALFNSIFALGPNGGTPNKEAVAYMGEQFRRTTEAGNKQPIRLSCQRNFGMLFTDGFSNASTTAINTNVDGSGAPFLDSVFQDAVPGTMGDIAAFYYMTNLRPDLTPGRVPVPTQCSVTNPDPRLDCQTDQHMNFYGITLNGRGLEYGVNAAATADPYTSNPTWPTNFPNRHPSAIDDIWHAGINSRGRFFNASSPKDISNAIQQVLSAVNATDSPSGTIALTGARIGAGSLVVQPIYAAINNGTDWYSTLTAQTVASNPITGVASFTNVWEASQRIPLAPARDAVWLGRGNAAPVPFNAANVGSLDNLCNDPTPGMSRCTGAEVVALGGTATPLTLTQAVSYLKGDQSLEIGQPGGKLRLRSTRLGDIINSTPVISDKTDDYGYRSLPTPYSASYLTYLTTKASGRKAVVFAAANDGMLHGFDGRTNILGGVERMAFIPQSVLGFTGNLLFPYNIADGNAQKFQHRYFVDGPMTVSDAYDGTAWRTALVASTGAGAKGVFALDTSGVSQTNGTFAAADRLWEISDLNGALSAGVRNNIGYVLGKPVIVPVKTGSGTGPVKWRAIFGNGYNSVSGKAVLFLVDIGTGAPTITMIEANEASAPAGKNGLGNIIAIDRWGPNAADANKLTSVARDGFADTVYAADQKGAIWKFDLRDAAPAAQTTPIFTTLKYTTGPEAGNRQPILGGLAASAGPGGGVLIFFGTGSFSFDNDASDSTLQSLYAVQDRSTGAPGPTLTRADLLEQSVVSTVGAVRQTTANTGASTQRGWYLDLPASERFVGNPRVESGIIFMPTYAASTTADCNTDGSNWLYGLNSLNGSAALSNVKIGSPTGNSPGTGTGALGLVTGGTAPVKDVAVLSSPRVSPLGAAASPAALTNALAAQCSMVIQVAGAPPLYLPRACGRQSWRQIQ